MSVYTFKGVCVWEGGGGKGGGSQDQNVNLKCLFLSTNLTITFVSCILRDKEYVFNVFEMI